MLNNYGAVLQAYALQSYLCKNNHCDVEVINFTTDAHLKADRILKWGKGSFFRNLVLFIFTLLHYPALQKRRIRTHAFKYNYFCLSQRYESIEKILNNPPQKDIHISGSDQVFNPSSVYMPVYYLSFTKGRAKKIAYAPSFGISKFSLQQKNTIRNAISDFDALSCRESSGAELLKELTGKEIPIVLDPTLILSSDDWKKVSVKPSINSKYILIYDLNGGYNLIKIAKRIQQATKYNIVCITGNVAKFYNGCKQIFSAGPGEFVGWFENAEYVVTDSFHGTMFSLIFGKPFNTYIATPSSATRIYSILNQLGLTDRIIENGKAHDFVYGKEIIYKIPDLSLISQPSIDFINQNIING